MNNYSRRNFLGKLIAIPAGLWLSNYHAFSAPLRNQIRITAIKAMQLDFEHDGCLIKIETDAGLAGYGESGVNSKIARAYIEHLTKGDGIIGGDPLSIERHFFYLTSKEHQMIPMDLISGIDIALWDLAGKILDLPVYKLLGGPFRNGCPMYSHGGNKLDNIMDPASCRRWVEYTKQQPEGFTVFKFGMEWCFPIEAPFHPNVTSAELKKLYQGFANIREAIGDDPIEIAIHCHNEFDTPSAIAIANTVQPLNVIFIEDPLNVPYSDGWAALKRGTRLPVLTGEKLRTLRQFKPFLDAQAVDFIHPDISFAGGFTGCMKIADYAAITRTPVALHNVGTLVRTYASAHLSMAIQNFYRSESFLGEIPGRVIEQMSTVEPPVVRNGILHVPDKPGLGLSLDESFLKRHLIKDEPWWG
ncbi:MAG: mandelate racemase/muconate lactonizing enzyme family protein [Bacteroidales bacterium]